MIGTDVMGNMTAPPLVPEDLLGRRLTSAELIWHRYTSGISDYQLYCVTVFLLAILYTTASLPYVILDWLRLPFFERFRIQSGQYNPPGEVWRCYLAVIRTMFLIILPLNLVSYPFFKIAGITSALPLPSLGSMALQLATFFIVEDYFGYWFHRWFHKGWLYDKIHYMHHEFTTPTAVSSTYAHWAEVLSLGVPSFLGPAIVQCHVVTLWAWILLRQWEAIETHSGYNFPWSPTHLIPFYGGADFHDYHHEVGGTSHCNFASVFTYCDWLYGTDKGYRVKRRAQRELAQKKTKMT